MDLLLATQAAQSQLRVMRPRSLETTALGAATIAGLAEGVFASLEEVASCCTPAETFEPDGDPAMLDVAYRSWLDALERSRGWAELA